ncbi:MAG: hypothetical protein AAFN27_16260 [Pseudomonadota bacterium]
MTNQTADLLKGFEMQFFIEMGQGFVSKAPHVISTSRISSCTLIAGIGTGGYAGAFHYPANSLESYPDCVKDMNLWASTLKPTQIILVHAINEHAAQGFMGNGDSGTSIGDKRGLKQWALQKCGAAPTVKLGTNVGMELTGMGAFAAGSWDQLESQIDQDAAIHLENKPAGHYLDHGGYGLVGKNRETG